MRLRRDLLIAVRLAIFRVIFLADTVLAMFVLVFSQDRCGKRRSGARRRIGCCMGIEEPAARAGSIGLAYRRATRQGQCSAKLGRARREPAERRSASA
jgi:hypothetical protein